MEGRRRGHVRFGPFDMDLGTGELRKLGTKIPLQSQPFDVLVVLIENPGELVTREEIRDRIWGPNSCGDFDQNLNKVIRKIRTALDDSADEPQYIETLPTRGYRFLLPVSDLQVPPAGPATAERQQPSNLESVPSPPHPEMPLRKPRNWLAPVLAGVLASGALLALWILSRREPANPPELIQRQLTTNSTENHLESAVLSPDGKYLLFGDQIGIHARLIATGETHTYRRPADLAGALWYPTAWFPDGAHFIAVSRRPTPLGEGVTSWLVTVLGGTTTLLRDDADAQAVSPDGSLIAFTTGGLETKSDVWIMGPRGEDAQRILAGGDLNTFRSVQWSPQGRRLVYDRTRSDGKTYAENSIESCDLKGRNVTVIVSGLAGNAGLCWLPGGRVIYSVGYRSATNENTNLWAISADPATGEPGRRARRLTNWIGLHADRFSFSADGRRMVVQKSSGLHSTFIGRLQADGRLETPRRLTFEDSSDVPMAWTADSHEVIFLSDRSGLWQVYKQPHDGAQAEQLTTGPDEHKFARLSPDGRWVLYKSMARDGARFARYMRLPLSGGPPEVVLDTKPDAIINCPVSPATDCILREWTASSNAVTITGFDPLTGRRHELFRMQLSGKRTGLCCDPSPNGSELAALLNDPPESSVRLLSYSGQITKNIPVRGWTNLNSVDWAADGQSLFVSSGNSAGSTLLRVHRSGRAEPVWTSTSGVTWAIQSRDGRYLALHGYSSYSNAWLLENF